MAAPPLVVRVVPVGTHLFNGHATVVGFQNVPNIALWEKAVTAPGVDGGDPIDQVTMWNLLWRTQTPRQLQAMTDTVFTCAVDPQAYVDIIEQTNVPQSIITLFNDLCSIRYWAWLRKFEWNEIKTDGTQPDAVVTISPGMLDYEDLENRPDEVNPIVTGRSGTALPLYV